MCAELASPGRGRLTKAPCHPCHPCSTRADVATHSGPADAWLIIEGKVFDVSKYLEDHPGGEEVLLDRVGQDATEDFEDVGHSQDARKQLATFEVGELPPSERKSAKAASGGGGGGMGVMALVPVLLAAGAGYYYMTQMQQ